MARAAAMAIQTTERRTYEIVLEDPKQEVAKALLGMLRAYVSRLPPGVADISGVSFLRDGSGSHRIRGVRVSNVTLREPTLVGFLGERFAGTNYNVVISGERSESEILDDREGTIDALTHLLEERDSQVEKLTKDNAMLSERARTAEDYALEVDTLLASSASLEDIAYDTLIAVSLAAESEAPDRALLKDRTAVTGYLGGLLTKIRDEKERLRADRTKLTQQVMERDRALDVLQASIRVDYVTSAAYAELDARLKRTITDLANARAAEAKLRTIDLHNANIDLQRARSEVGRYKAELGKTGSRDLGDALERLRRYAALETAVVGKQRNIEKLQKELEGAKENLRTTVNELGEQLAARDRRYAVLEFEAARLRRDLETSIKLENLSAEEVLVEAFKRIYGNELDRAIGLYNEKFEAGIPDDLRIAVMTPQELIFERYGKELADISINVVGDSITPDSLIERLNSCLVEFDETEYAIENSELYRMAKLAEKTYRVKREKDLNEDERRAKEIVDNFEAARAEHYRVREQAERLAPQIRDAIEEHDRCVAATEEFRKDRLPLRATFGCFVYSLGTTEETNVLRFLVPTNENNYAQPAAVEFVMAVASSLKGRQAEVKTGLLRGCHYIDLVYRTDISDRVERVVNSTMESVEKSTLAKLGANINIRYVGGINNGSRD